MGHAAFQYSREGKSRGLRLCPAQALCLQHLMVDILASGTKPTFAFSDSGAEWYNVMSWSMGPLGQWLTLNMGVDAVSFFLKKLLVAVQSIK